MILSIYKQAGLRLATAERKAVALANTHSMEEALQLWSELLTEQHRFFNRLGNAMQGSSERGWWERVLDSRKKDSLMNYLQQARNADEHGRASIADPAAASLRIGKSGTAFVSLSIQNGRTTFSGWEGKPGQPLSVDYKPARLIPLAVENRHQRYEPPVDHPSVITLAVAATAYLRDVYEQAGSTHVAA